MKVLLRKHKENGDIEFALVCFNSTTTAVINSEYDLDKSFQEILYRRDNWINEGSGWITESMDGEYVNISTYSSLSGSSYIELPDKLRNSMKGLINIKNNDNKCMKVLTSLFLKNYSKIIARLNKKIIFTLMYFVMKII